MEKCGNAQPWQTIVVENAPLGIRSAVAAQCFTIAINSGPLSNATLMAEQPDLLFANINQLSRAWHDLVPTPTSQQQPELGADWEENCRKIIGYMERCHRRPSKHRPEDHQMLNWMKYNKKRLARGEMSPARQELFRRLLAVAEKYRRVNQFQPIK